MILGVVGYFLGLAKLNELGGRTTAFNLAAVSAIVVGFLAYNIVVAVQGNWSFPDYNPPMTTQGFRQILGFFALVQGFEASRYLTAQYSAELRIQTMRTAQVIATVAAVLFPASALILFAEVRPQPDPAAVVQIAQVASPVLPWLVVLLAIGSEASATINALASRSDVMVLVSDRRIARRYTFPLLAAGSILIVLVTNVLSAVAAASRVFATFYVVQLVAGLERLAPGLRAQPRADRPEPEEHPGDQCSGEDRGAVRAGSHCHPDRGHEPDLGRSGQTVHAGRSRISAPAPRNPPRTRSARPRARCRGDPPRRRSQGIHRSTGS